jgi:hypothetical protein
MYGSQRDIRWYSYVWIHLTAGGHSVSRLISAYEKRDIAMENRSNAKTSQSFLAAFRLLAMLLGVESTANVGRMKGRDVCICLSRSSRSKTTPPIISQQRKAPAHALVLL